MCWHIARSTDLIQTVSVAGCLGYDVLGWKIRFYVLFEVVSVAGCLGYDVLVYIDYTGESVVCVSVAGCLGYDVLVSGSNYVC